MRTLLRLAALSPILFAVGACATARPSAAQRSRPATPKPMPADHAKFRAFIRDFRPTAIRAGIKPAIYDRSMRDISLNTHIQELNAKQPEFVKPVWEYLDTAVSDLRVQHGRDKLAANATMLANLQSRYGVPKEILVAIWGIETNYGAQMGSYNMFEALATLGYDGRRAAFGRRELIAAMTMEQREGYDPKQMVSSWAGAFGETQFMPTTFLNVAVDGDGDGKINLWNSPADALASSATLLSKAGWHRGEPGFTEVTLPRNFPYAEADPDDAKPLVALAGIGGEDGAGRRAGRRRRTRRAVPAGRRQRAGLPGLPQFPDDPALQQRDLLCIGGGVSGPSHRRPCRDPAQLAARRPSP